MTFQHHTANGALALLELLAQAGDDFRLAAIVLVAVAVAAVDDERGGQVPGRQGDGGIVDGLAAVIGPGLRASAQYQVAVGVAGGLQDGGRTLLGE